MATNPNLSQEELNKLADKLREIERLSLKFNENINTANLQDLENNAGEINILFEALIKKEQELGAETDYLISSFQELTNKIKTSTVGIQESTKALRGLSSIAEQLNSHQKGYNELSSKELAVLQQKAKIERDRLVRSRDVLANEQNLLTTELQRLQRQGASNQEIEKTQKKLDRVIDQYDKINNLLSVNDVTLADLNTQLEKELRIQKDIEKQLGVTGIILKGISKIPFLGDAVNTKKALEDATTVIKNGGGAIGGMKAALESVGSDVKTFLKDPLVVVSFLVTQIVTTFKSLDDGIGQFAKNMNYSYQDAAKLNNKFNDIANSSMDVAVTTKGIRETMMAMGQALGTNATLNAKDAVTMTKLREQAGFTNDELAKMQELTLATGGNLEDNTKNLLGAANITAMNNGVLLNEKEIMKDIAKTSAATKLSLGGSGEALGKAAAQAKALGMSLEQVDKIADSLLQIESSISNELEAELLTGKNLNLEGARLAALNNDMEGLSKEIAKNYGTAAEFSKMNRIQQEAAAKAVGMSREELAGTLVRAEALKSMSGEQAEKAKQAFDARVKEVGLEQAQKELKEGQLQKMMEQQSVQERFTQAIEKLKELFISLVDPLMPVVDAFAGILKVVGPIAGILGMIVKGAITPFAEGIKYIYDSVSGLIGLFTGANKQLTLMQTIVGTIAGIYLAIKGYQLALNVIQGVRLGLKARESLLDQKALFTANQGIVKSVGMAIFNAISSFSKIPFGVGVALGIAAAAGIASMAAKYMTGNDVVSPGYGKRTLMGPEGAIALNDKDTVIAGTNLFPKKGDDVISAPEGSISAPSSGGQIDYNALASAVVSALKNAPMTVNSTLMLDKDILAKQTVQAVSDNATKVGTAAAVGTSKI